MQFPYAQWCVLVQSVAAAQVEACRLRAQFEQGLRAADHGPEDERERAYKFFGDFLVGMPDRLRVLEGAVQRAAYLLAEAGPDTLRPSMPVGDLKMVEEAVTRSASCAPVTWAAGLRGRRAGVLVVLRGPSALLVPPGRSAALAPGDRGRAAALLLPLARAAAAQVGGDLRGASWEAFRGPGRLAHVRLWGHHGGR